MRAAGCSPVRPLLPGRVAEQAPYQCKRIVIEWILGFQGNARLKLFGKLTPTYQVCTASTYTLAQIFFMY
jgi:hypothetical protein